MLNTKWTTRLQAAGHPLDVAHFLADGNREMCKFFNLLHVAAALKKDEHQHGMTLKNAS